MHQRLKNIFESSRICVDFHNVMYLRFSSSSATRIWANLTRKSIFIWMMGDTCGTKSRFSNVLRITIMSWILPKVILFTPRAHGCWRWFLWKLRKYMIQNWIFLAWLWETSNSYQAHEKINKKKSRTITQSYKVHTGTI